MDSYLKVNQLDKKQQLNSSIISLEITDPFNEVIKTEDLPESLKLLSIKSKAFTKGFSKDFSLRNIETIVFPLSYTLQEYLPTEAITSPTIKLKEIVFGYNWNPPLPFVLPQNIEIVTFGGQFTDAAGFFSQLSEKTPYKKLVSISLGGIFNKDITPTSLETVFIAKNKNLRTLKLSNAFSAALDLSECTNLKTIIFNTKFNSLDFRLNTEIQEIQFGTEFNQPFDLSPYKYLKSITLKKNFKSKLINSSKKKGSPSFFLLNTLDISKIDEGFPIYELAFENIQIGELIVNERQFFILELFVEKAENPSVKGRDMMGYSESAYLLENSNTIAVTKNDEIIYRVSSRDFSNIEEASLSVNVLSKKKRIEEKYEQIPFPILDTVYKNPCLFSLIVNNKYYNVDYSFYKKESKEVQTIHRLYNGEFSESLTALRKETLAVFNHKDFKPFDFFVSSIYNVPLNSVLRGKTDITTTETESEEKTAVHNFFMDPETLIIIAAKINLLMLYKVPRLKMPLIVRRSLSHDFFEKCTFSKKCRGVVSDSPLPIKGIVEDGMMSTSLYIHPGFTYNQRSKNLNPTEETKSWMMVLILPAGVPAFDTNNFYNNKMEKEILLPAGIEYTIYGFAKDYKIESQEAYERVFLNKFSLWENEYKRRIENDCKSLNDTINIFFAYVTGWIKDV